MKDEWNDDFVREWIKLPPILSDKDLRGALYVSREHAPKSLLQRIDYHPTAIALLDALLTQPDMAESIKEDIAHLPKAELSVIMNRLLEKAKQEQEWGVPSILEACLVVSKYDEGQTQRLANFLIGIMPSQIRASIVPKIADEGWARSVFEKWLGTDISQPVKKAINNKLGNK